MKKKKLKKKVIILIISLFTLLILLLGIIFIFFNPLLQIKLNGKNQTIEVFSKYKEQGVKISGTKNKYTKSGKVNTSKLGTYTITYKIKSLKTIKKVTRKVIQNTRTCVII